MVSNIKQSLDEIVTRPMDRKQFLASTGAALLTLVGVSAIVKSLESYQNPNRTNGYGSSPYGGSKESGDR